MQRKLRTRPEKATEAVVQQALRAGSPRQGAEQQLERLRLLQEGAQMLPQQALCKRAAVLQAVVQQLHHIL